MSRKAKTTKKATTTTDGKAKAPSAKMIVYGIYKKRKAVEPKQAADLLGKAKVKVKESTVRSWISGWNRGKFFPTR